ncbi:MAG: glycosyltransferase family 4 protein [Muribaculaceae bacterium]|nr:glycosyltransferase family 4 protein [Muribaculaceae bacterium]
MNIVHIIFNIRPGGMEHFLIDLVEAQSRQDNVTVVIVNRNNDNLMMQRLEQHCRLVEIGRPEGSYNPRYFIKLNRVLKQLKPDVVNFHDRRLGAMILKHRDVSYIFTCHDMLQPPGFARRADKIIAVSGAVASWLGTNYGLKSTVIPNGIAVDRIARRGARDFIKPIKLVTVARLDHIVKGQHILLKAVAQLQAVDWTLDLIGNGQSRIYLEDLANQLDIKARVKFITDIDREEILGRLSGYDIFILPSLNEAFSIALAEAMSALVPVIISNLDGPKLIADNGKYATVFTPCDVNDLARKIREVIADYPTAYSKAVAAQGFVKETFGIDKTATRYREFYNKK